MTRSHPTRWIKRVTILVSGRYNFKTHLEYQLYDITLLWRECDNSSRLFDSFSLPCLCRICGGNGGGFSPTISVFPGQLSFNHCSIYIYQPNVVINAPLEAAELKHCFTPSQDEKLSRFYAVSPDACSYTLFLQVNHNPVLLNV